jgi:hypothetical protein
MAVLAACSAEATGFALSADQAVLAADPNGLPCAVDDVLSRKCRMCHQNPPLYGAPMPLLTWDDLHGPARSTPSKKVFELVSTRIHSPTRPMPPMGPLGDADMRPLDEWIAAGAPRATDTCQPPTDGGTGDGDGGLGCHVDQPITPTHAWPVTEDHNDEYVCYGIDITTSQKRQAIAIAPRVQNHRVVHHLDLFQAPESFSREPQACSPFAASTWRMVYAWAPGGRNMILPPEAGFPLEGTTHYVVQVHYANPNHLTGETDASGVDVCTTDQLRPNDADVMAFGSQHFTIQPRASLDLTCSFSPPAGTPAVRFFAMMPHMHNYGQAIMSTLYPSDGSNPVDLGTQPHWDINNQTWFSINATAHAGDRIATRCQWANTTDNAVSFGDSSADEMCYGYAMYYPRIVQDSWSWSVPAAQSTCSPTAH